MQGEIPIIKPSIRPSIAGVKLNPLFPSLEVFMSQNKFFVITGAILLACAVALLGFTGARPPRLRRANSPSPSQTVSPASAPGCGAMSGITGSRRSTATASCRMRTVGGHTPRCSRMGSWVRRVGRRRLLVGMDSPAGLALHIRATAFRDNPHSLAVMGLKSPSVESPAVPGSRHQPENAGAVRQIQRYVGNLYGGQLPDSRGVLDHFLLGAKVLPRGFV